MGMLLDIAKRAAVDGDRQQPANVPSAAPTIAREQRNNTGAGIHTHAELRALVDAVAAFHGFTLEQTAEAQQIAQADPVAALECFRVLAAQIPQPVNRNGERKYAGIT